VSSVLHVLVNAGTRCGHLGTMIRESELPLT
jgi:hypothetical protein